MATSPFEDELRLLKSYAANLERELSQLRFRINELETRHARSQLPPLPAPTPERPQIVAQEQIVEKAKRAVFDRVKARQPERQPTVSGSPADMEMRIGGTWLNRAGALVLLLGIAFFMKYAFDQGWISETMRVVLAAVTGLILIGVGELCLARKMRDFAAGLLGCGVCVLYLAAFGAHNFYHLVSHQTATLCYIAVTTLSVIISVHGDFLPVAILALVGGFATPIALNTGKDQQVELLTYVIALDLGLLLCATIRRWDVLRPLCWLGTVALFGGWFLRFYADPSMWRTVGFIWAFYALFHGEMVISARRRSSNWPGLIAFLITLNNCAFFASTYFLLRDRLPQWMGLFAVVSAIVQGLGAWAIRADEPSLFSPRRTLWVNGAGMLALAVPMQFDRYLVSVGWAVQSVITLWFCRPYADRWLRVKGLGVLIAASCHLWAFEFRDDQLAHILIQVGLWKLSWLILCFVFVGLCAYGGGTVLIWRRQCDEEDKTVAGLLLSVGSALMLAIFAEEWERYLATWWWVGLALAWAAVGLRIAAASLLAAGIVITSAAKFFIWDTFGAMAQGGWANLQGVVLNRAVITGIALWAAVLLVRITVMRNRASWTPLPYLSWLSTMLAFLAALIVTWTGTFEIARIFRFEDAVRLRFADARLAMHVTLSVFWGVNATVLLVIGFVRSIAILRYMAILLYGVTVVKVLLFDLAKLESGYRIVSFIVLGVLLLLASLVYQRVASRISLNAQRVQ